MRLNEQVRSQSACEVRECIQGDTLTHRILLDDDALDHLPASKRLLDHPLFEPLLTYCGREPETALALRSKHQERRRRRQIRSSEGPALRIHFTRQ